MQRIFNIDKWSLLTDRDCLEFSNPRPRTVRVEVNAPVETALYIADDQGETRFLALVKGRETIEFGSTGSFQLTVEGHECWIYTADGDDIAMRVIAPQIFTKIAERRRRNPELEQIAHLMQRNMEKRLEQQAGELDRLYQRREREREEARAAQSQAAGLPAAPGDDEGPADDAGASASPAAAPPGGNPTPAAARPAVVRRAAAGAPGSGEPAGGPPRPSE